MSGTAVQPQGIRLQPLPVLLKPPLKLLGLYGCLPFLIIDLTNVRPFDPFHRLVIAVGKSIQLLPLSIIHGHPALLSQAA